MKKNRRLMLVALLLLAIVSIGASFAYWAVVDLNDTIENNTITIGTGVSSVVSASTEDQTEGVLVPVGQAENSIEANAVEFVIFTFEVVWATNTLDDPTGTVAALIENLTLTGADSSNLSGLVN